MSSSAEWSARDMKICELVDALTQLQDRLVDPAALDHHTHSQGLRVACRDVIGRAKGIVIERYMVGLEESQRLLTLAAEHSDRRSRVLAESVASTGALPVAMGTSAVPLAITGTVPEAAA